MSVPIELPVPFERASRVRRGLPRRLVGTGFAAAVLVVLAFIAPNLGAFLVSSDPPMPSQVTFLTYGVSIRRGALDAAIARDEAGDQVAAQHDQGRPLHSLVLSVMGQV